MNHQKRQVVPKNWPIPRKGTTFVIKGTAKGIPVLIVLRDMLKLAQNRKEVKLAIHKKDLLLCGKPIMDEKQSMELFDVLTIVPAKKNYKLTLTNTGKLNMVEISEKESTKKITKVIGKKTIKGKKTQFNLLDGRNYIAEVKVNVNDSVILDFKKDAISKVLPIKEKANVFVIGGKHSGKEAKIIKLIPEHKMIEVEEGENKFNVLIKHILVLE